MPATGRVVERAYSAGERTALEQAGSEQGLTTEQIFTLLGDSTCDVYLNETASWRNVPVNVWRYTLGGYPVIKKWLSYREADILGRALTPDEARWVMEMAQRIAALLLMGPDLDANYERVRSNTYLWLSSPK